MPGPELTPPGSPPGRPAATSPPPGSAQTPPPLQPPGHAGVPGQGNAGIPPWVWIAGLFLVLGLLAVVVLLPDAVKEKPELRDTALPLAPGAPAPAEAPRELLPEADTKPEVVTAQAPEPSKTLPTEAIQSLYTQLLKQQATLETQGAPDWAPDAWQAIMQTITEGEQALAKGQADAARNAYESALAELQTLPDSRHTRFLDALAKGKAALDTADGSTAQTQFKLAVAANPESEEAATGLKRASTIEEVTRTYQRGEAHESNGALQDALNAYQKAAELDPLYEPAKQGLQRVSEVLAEQAYQQHMTDLLAAIAAGRLGDAQQALAAAKAIKGDTPELRDASRRMGDISQTRRLDQLRKQAGSAEAQEDWQSAKSRYQQALKLDPASSFAQDGLSRSEEFIALNGKLDHYLKRPELLRDAGARDTAGNLLLIANAQSVDRPKLRAKAERLSEMRVAASKLIPVTLHSDGKTQVTIYRVGRLGTFQRHQLELTPGDYTVVGSRDGFRDVRHTLTIVPQDEAKSINISCQERI